MMLEPEKLQNRGKQGWPDAGKGTGHKGDKKVNTHTHTVYKRLLQLAQARPTMPAFTSLSSTFPSSVCAHLITHL